MSFNFILWFFIALGIYLLVVLVVAIIKKFKNKKSKRSDTNIDESKIDVK